MNQSLSDTHSNQTNWLPSIDWNVKLFGAHLQRVEQGWSMPKESHMAFEILIVLDGCQETIMERNRYFLHTGDIMLVPPGFKHENRCMSKEGMRYFTAHFNVDDPLFREEMIKNSQILYPSGSEENQKLRPIMEDWIHMSEQDQEYTTTDRFRLQARLFELLGILAQVACSGRNDEESLSPTALQYAKAIAESIKARFNPYAPEHGHEDEQQDPLLIQDVVNSLGISTGYGQEVFRKVYGISPRRYLSELKLNEAKVLIQQSELSLKDVAAKLGYTHLSHFSRQFKRWTGMSPLQYRQGKK